jgi:carbamoyltransferase
VNSLVLGISAYYHDSAAALVADGVPIAAAQEERFTRRRHDSSFPAQAVRYVLGHAGADLADLTAVVYHEDPVTKFSRVMASYLGAAPTAYPVFHATLPGWLSRKLRTARTVQRELGQLGLGQAPKVATRRHHESHAASAFYPSPYENAAVLCIDGVGEWATTTIWHGRGTRLDPVAELRFPHSLGMLYSAFTYFCGFKVDSGEYKLMGLAPYGRPSYTQAIREHLVDIKPDGSIRLNLRNFAYLRGQVMTGRGFERLFGGPRRQPEAPLTEREFDLAASVQQVTEEAVLRLARTARRLTGEPRLCMAGGVALNCVANGKVSDAGVFDEIWVQPAAGDAGCALGSALAAAAEQGSPRAHVGSGRDAMSGALLGPGYSDEEIGAFLDARGAPSKYLGAEGIAPEVAALLARGRVVGWFQGRMEFGPRALGARSILGDPRDRSMQTTMNLKIKFRESFRPFAPAVLAERAADYFDLRQPSPYMLLVAAVTAAQRLADPAATREGPSDQPEQSPLTGLDLLKVPRSTVPAVTHVDHSARVQTVTPGDNPLFHRLLAEFERETGCPVLVNTSFNVRGEPIVRTPLEAYTCFMRTDIDALALGGYLLSKEDQPDLAEQGDWREEIPLD